MALSGFHKIWVVSLVGTFSLAGAGELVAVPPKLQRKVADERRVEALAAARAYRPSALGQTTQTNVLPGERLQVPLQDTGGKERSLLGPATDAVAWLKANQNPSGSWGTTYEFVDTCTVIETLVAADPDCAELADGEVWLSAQAEGNYEHLARQIIALAGVSGYDTLAASLANDLLAARNSAEPDPGLPNWPEGGWGIDEGYETDCLTTALAMKALDAVGLGGGFMVNNEPLAAGATNTHEWDIPEDATKVRLYVTAVGSTINVRMKEGSPPGGGDPYFQLPPGSWLIVFPDSGLPFTAGHNYITVQSTGPAATYTMTASYETLTFNTLTLAEPLDYLREAQNVDGGWGLQRGQPTEFYTTLHVLLTLGQWLHYDFETEHADGITYLKSQQLGDGSFGYDSTPISYVTALGALNLVHSETYPFGTETANAIAALLAMQDVDGSWVQEAYDTALAILALWDHNQDPTAEAGPGQEITDADEDCLEDVTLDGTGSNDVDGTIESYVWTEGDVEIATGPSPVVTLAVGAHVIELTVTDNGGKSASDTVIIDIVGTGVPSDVCHCCFPEDECEDLDPVVCVDSGGTVVPGACAFEACCMPDDTCVMADPDCCELEGGTPLPGEICSGPPVPPCCLSDGECAMLDPLCCVLVGGNPLAPEQECTLPEACCLPDDTCQDLDPLCCTDQGGTPLGPGTACSGITIACCIDEGAVTTCRDVDLLCCDELGGFITPYSEACLGDGDSDGIDDACVEPPHTIKWEQLPDPGLSGLHAHDWDDGAGYQWITLADDWLCEGGEVTDLHWWGNYEDNDIGSGISHFQLSIHECNSMPPGWHTPLSPPIWLETYVPLYMVNETDTGMVNNLGDTIYKYEFYLTDPFPQIPTNNYWFDITAISNDPNDPAKWRWQESRRGPAPPLGHAPAAQYPNGTVWSPITWGGTPEEFSDMAFVITSSGCPPADPPTVPAGEPGYDKVRHISFELANPGVLTALRVTLTTMPPPYAGFSGQQMWVGPALEKCENGGVSSPPCPPVPLIPDSYQSANLQCTPHCMDYGSVGVIHVTDDEIIPGAVYDVQAIDCECDFGVEADYSSSLTINTSTWADLVKDCTTTPCGPPDGSTGIVDVTAILDKFKNLPGAVMKSRADIDPNLPDWLVNITDVTFCLDAFLGFTYPPPGWPGPGGCGPMGARVESYSNSGCLGSRDQSSTEPCVEDDVIELTPSLGTLDVVHWNASYNCCQDDIKVSSSLEGSLLSLIEEEVPPGGSCFCFCCFNVEARVIDLPAGEYTVDYCWLDYEQGSRCHTDDIVIP